MLILYNLIFITCILSKVEYKLSNLYTIIFLFLFLSVFVFIKFSINVTLT